MAEQLLSDALANELRNMFLAMLRARTSIFICHVFATVCQRAIPFVQRIRDFSSRDVSFSAAKTDYAFYVSPGGRFDTVGVWGSNPHAVLTKNSIHSVTIEVSD